ncbi:MAG: hypothetical protein OHK0029_22600 [Armatimonadaceae bacterium]
MCNPCPGNVSNPIVNSKSPPNNQPARSSSARVGTGERQRRTTEAVLLLMALLILWIGSGLALIAKGREARKTSDVVLLNQADAGQLSGVLKIPAEAARKLVAEREKRQGFSDVDALAGLRTLVPRASFRAAYNRLAVRSWADAQTAFLLCVGGLSLFWIVAHLLLRHVRPRSDPFLLPIAVLLTSLGVLLLFALKDPLRDRLSFVGQTVGILSGGTLAVLLPLTNLWNRLPLHRYGYVYAVAAVGLTALLGVLGSGPGGVRLSVAGMQPVEGIKILMVLFLAAYLAERGSLLNDPLRRFGPIPLPRKEDVLPLLALYALPLILFAIVRDLGPALLLFSIFLTLLYLVTGRGIYVAAGAGVLLLGGFIGYKLRLGVLGTRIDMWLSPWQNNSTSGDHLALGWWGLASGGIIGSGLGLGGSNFIPRAGSDLAFAAIGEEAGLLATVAVLACFLVLTARGLRISERVPTQFERYTAAGLTGLLTLQTLVLVGGTLGLIPLAGITLPLVSYGKSSLIASFLILGILLSLSDRDPQAPVAASAEYRAASDRLMRFFALTLGLLCVLRLLYLQFFMSWAVAGRVVVTPDADRVRRPHINPRLLALANEIPRGRLLDRNGAVLAVTKGNRRVYPYGAAFGHLIGYADPAVGGPTGLEAEFAPQLRGFSSWADLVRVWQAKDLPGFRLPEGKDVILTLDAELQKAALAALKERAGQIRDRKTGRRKNRGAVVVLDVQTGGVLAAVTLPTFDPNKLTVQVLQALNTDVNNDYPLINRAISGYYPPGSTFKMVTAASLLQHNQGDFTTLCNHVATRLVWKANGETYARKRVVDDESERAHGRVNLSEAVEESCNIYFARAGIELGAEKLRQTAEQFGFRKLPSLSLFAQELPDIAYGQGPLLTTPLEMANVAATVANGGTLLMPRYLKERKPEVRGTPLAAEDAERLARMMRQVVTSGTAAGKFGGVGATVAGKTGTAQNDRYDRMSHSWFIGFAPAEKPRVAIAVIVENGGYGAAAAVPVARDVLRQYFMD